MIRKERNTRSRMKESIAAGILTIMLFFIIVIPLVIIAHSLIQQASEIYTTTNIENIKELFINQLTTSIESLFYGTVTVAAIEAIVAMIGFYFLGVPAPILWAFIIGLTALIPGIGATLVWVPMTIISYVQGNTSQAIAIGLFGFLILSTLIDTVLRAKIMGMRAEIHPLIIVIGVLGGLASFGFIGMFIGPLVLSLFELVLEIYTEKKDEIES